ncbi:MAG: hypothetical protein LBG58_10720 [Planctomycetaceae bacterium]|nr:hypothetical protein [Planctomycetaceae bacterium]
MISLGNRTRRDAAGWYVLPFQGEEFDRQPLMGVGRTPPPNAKRSAK